MGYVLWYIFYKWFGVCVPNRTAMSVWVEGVDRTARKHGEASSLWNVIPFKKPRWSNTTLIYLFI